MTLAKDYTSMLIVCALLGIAKGIRSVYMSIVIPSYIPLERLASASAIQLFGNGVAMMCIGPILGWFLLMMLFKCYILSVCYYYFRCYKGCLRQLRRLCTLFKCMHTLHHLNIFH